MDKFCIPGSLSDNLHTILIDEHIVETGGIEKRLRAVLSKQERVLGFIVYVASDDSYWYFEKFESAQQFYAE